MFRTLLSATILLSVASIPSVARAATPFEFKPVKIDLPDSDKMFPDGPGADAVNNNCLACHSTGMVLNQPALSKQAQINTSVFFRSRIDQRLIFNVLCGEFVHARGCVKFQQ